MYTLEQFVEDEADWIKENFLMDVGICASDDGAKRLDVWTGQVWGVIGYAARDGQVTAVQSIATELGEPVREIRARLACRIFEHLATGKTARQRI